MEFDKVTRIQSTQQFTINSNIVFKYVPLAKDIKNGFGDNDEYTFSPTILAAVRQDDSGNITQNPDTDISEHIKNIENLAMHHMVELYAIMHCICNFVVPFHNKEEIEVVQEKDGWLKIVSISQEHQNLENLLDVLMSLKSLVQIKEHDYEELNIKFTTKNYSQLKNSKDQSKKRLYQDFSAELSDDTALSLLDAAITLKSSQARDYLKQFPLLNISLEIERQAEISFSASNIDTMIQHVKMYADRPILKNLLNKFVAKTINDYLNIEVKQIKKQKAFSINSHEGELIYGLLFQFGFLEEKDMKKQQTPRYKAEKIRGFFSHDTMYNGKLNLRVK